MGSLNKVLLIGRLGADPEVRFTASGKAATTVNLATNRTWKDADGNKQEKTDWHRVCFWGRLAEVIGEYVPKGGQIFVEGRQETRSWETEDGQKRYITEVVAEKMQMLDSRGQQQQSPSEQGQAEPDEDFEQDDLPF